MQNQFQNDNPSPRKSNGWLPYAVGITIGLAVVCAAGFAVFAMFFYKPTIPKVAAEATATPSIVTFVTVAPTDTQSAQAQTVPEATQPPASTPEAPQQPAPAETPIVPTETPPAPPAAPSGLLPMASPDYGIQAFLYWRPEVAERDLQLINDIKFNWVKQGFSWREIEGAGKGQFDWSNADRMMEQIDAHGLNVIARISTQPAWVGGNYPDLGPPDNYQDFADFLTALATRYKGRIDAYQIWNEPNLAREWGNRPPSPAEYTELLKVAYQAIKVVDPNAWVITAGLAPTSRDDTVAMPDTKFVQGMYDAGADPYFDALGVNGAGYKVAPETDPDVVANDPTLNNNDPSPPEAKRIYCFRHIEDVRQVMVQNGDADKRVVVLEFGWTVDPRPESPYHWYAVSEVEQRDYILRAYKYAQENWQPWIGVMNLIYLADVDWTDQDEQTYWSITYPLYPDLKARPAYWGLMELGQQRQR